MRQAGKEEGKGAESFVPGKDPKGGAMERSSQQRQRWEGGT